MRSGTVAVLVVAGCLRMGAQTLRSPWDATNVTASERAYACPAAPVFASTVDPGTYYIDAHASVIDPAKQAAYQRATQAPIELSRSVTLAADAWLATGSRPAVRCVYSLLGAAARADAWAGKMPDYSGVYTQNWLLSAVAIAYLKVRGAYAGAAGEDAAIQAWFARLGVRVTDFFSAEAGRLGNAHENNHLYWAGLALAAEGIADDDRKAYGWGLGAYQVGADNVQADGSLTAEMDRGQMALHYHLYALGPLVITAELAAANGTDLYAEDGGALHRLVALCAAGLADPGVFAKRTGITQVVTLPYVGSDIGWAVPYVRRYPNAELSGLIAKAPWVRYTTWGGEPPR